MLLCDEVTSALDTIVAANIMALLERLRDDLGVSYLFISHDLSTVASFSDEIAVLYGGLVVEYGPSAQVLSGPSHPYTRLLIASAPEMKVGWLEAAVEGRAARAAMGGVVANVNYGCPFTARCPLAIPGTCDVTDPPLRRVAASDASLAGPSTLSHAISRWTFLPN